MQRRSLPAILELDQIDPWRFRTVEVTETGMRTFGGSFAGQAIIAAGRTVSPERRIHSAHAHFLRPGDSSRPVTYLVEPIRDGGSYSTRRVEARQGDTVTFHLVASFHAGDDTDLAFQAHQVRVPTPVGDSVIEAPSADEELRTWARRLTAWLGMDLHFPEPPARSHAAASTSTSRQSIWLRSTDGLPDDPLLHAAALAHGSDLLLLSTALAPHGRSFSDGDLDFASLDHTIWFHHPTRADEWFLHDMQAIWTGHGRALTNGALFDQQGTMVASTAQEGMIRPRSTTTT